MIYSFTSLSIVILSLLTPYIYMQKYPDDEVTKKISDILITLGYKSIYYYSIIQIKLEKINKILMPYVKELYQVFSDSNNSKTQIEIICKNGNIKKKIDLAKALNEIKLEEIKENINNDFELIIISGSNDELSSSKNKVCCSNISNEISYDLSNIKFINLSVTHNNNTYSIDLKNNNENYYIVNNKIDSSFLKYYLVNVLKVDVNEDFSYKLQLMDHQVNILHLDESHDIIIEKNNYRIENKNKKLVEEITHINMKGSVNSVKECKENNLEEVIEDIEDDFEKIDNIVIYN
jgi:hypothetical protein